MWTGWRPEHLFVCLIDWFFEMGISLGVALAVQGTHTVEQADFELRSLFLCFPSIGIKGVSQHRQEFFFYVHDAHMHTYTYIHIYIYTVVSSRGPRTNFECSLHYVGLGD